MAWTLVSSAEAENPNPGTTLDCSTSLNVAAGDLLVAWCKYEGANGTFAVAKSTGSPANTFTLGTEANHSNGDLNASFAWVLSAAADASATFRLTTSARAYRGIIVYQFRPDSGDTVSMSSQATGTGTGTSVASGNISPSGADLLCLGGFAQYADITLSSRAINSVAADGFEDAAATDCSMWYRILTSGFTGAASVTQSSSNAWICNAVSFDSAAAGGGTNPKGPLSNPLAGPFGGPI